MMRIQLRRDASGHPESIAGLAVDLLKASAAVGRCIDTMEAGNIVMATPELLALHEMKDRLSAAAASLEAPLFHAMHRDAGEFHYLTSLERAEAALAACRERTA